MDGQQESFTSYRDLMVWKAAVDLSVACYEATHSFPRSEIYGMTSQIRRSSASIAANIAEGHGRESTSSFIQFLRFAQGSLKELETHLVISERVNLLGESDVKQLMKRTEEIGKMLRSLIRRLQSR